MTSSDKSIWDIAAAREFYNIPVWSEGYFDIDSNGHIVAKLDNDSEIDLFEVGQELQKRELSFPILIRFPQILRSRIDELCLAFRQAISEGDFDTVHTPLYPIKVNQQRTVIENILSTKQPNIGLEVGSKTELLAALGMLRAKNALLVCNGYKDRSYIRIALYAQCMGIQVFIVIEKLSEFVMIEQECARLGITPQLGVRIRLSSIAGGNWQNTGGRNAKFGLDTQDLLRLLDALKKQDRYQWLRLLHFHMGSQISNLDDFSQGLQEVMQIFSQLNANGFNLDYVDVGGGLAVDYSAQQDTSYFSKSYSMRAYARAVINSIGEFCVSNNLSFPHVFTENGRAITAHHAVLITNVVETDATVSKQTNILQYKNWNETLLHSARQISELIEQNMPVPIEQIDEFQQLANQQFLTGRLDLKQRAQIESFINSCLHAQVDSTKQGYTANKYYCNFSIFQSMPDVWGLQQIFPITPLARLDEPPTQRARLHDLTCDSDGQISTYTCAGKLTSSLSLHPITTDEQYMLGFFLVGAYQEVLGDVHNLFGDTHTINVECNVHGELLLTELESGDCIDELLASVHINGKEIVENCDFRLNENDVAKDVQNDILEEIKDALFGYTYLDSIDRVTHRIKG